MTNTEYRNTMYEVDEILKILDKSWVDKIPNKIKQEIKKNKAKYYNFKLDNNKRLSEQKLLKTTEQYLTMLYLKFICNEQEKLDVLKAMHNKDNN